MRLSLIITTFNRPDALLLVLNSVECQSQLPQEVIIADDGSDHLTKKCIDNFKQNSRLKVIHSWQEDKGFRVAKSRNKAIAKSSGEYIVLIDGDMILHRKFIEDHAKNAQIGFFIQGARVLLNQDATDEVVAKKNINLSFFSNGLINRKNAIYSNIMSRLFIRRKKNIIGIKACNLSFFKEDCISINGFNNDIEGWGKEDSEFIVRLINNNVSQKNIHFNLIQYHLWHQNSPRKYLKTNQLILDRAVQKRIKWCNNGLNNYL